MKFLSMIFRFFSGAFLKVTNTQTFPAPLSRKEEEECFVRAKEGDMDARNTLIEHNLRLVAHIVKKYYANHKNQEDLMSIGTVGLIKAVDTFDPKNGARFATYASKCLQNEILMYFRAQKKIGVEVSMNETIDVDKEGNPLTYIDVISCDDTIAEDLAERIDAEAVRRLMETRLEEREKRILIRRYGLDNRPPCTQREIAKQMKISRSYVSRIEKSALCKIREGLTGAKT